MAEVPENLLYTKYSLIGRSTLADYHRQRGNLELAEKIAADALAIIKTIQHPERKDVWFLEIMKEPFRSYAATVRDLGRWDMAETSFHECVVIEDQLYENNPLQTPYALGRAIFAAEELRAARKRHAGSEKEAELLQKAKQRLSDMRKTNAWSEFDQGIERLISDPDAPSLP